MASVSPWKPLLLKALESNAHLKHSAFFQLATVGTNGRPSNRTVVFRGFEENCDKVHINTDARSTKIEEIKHLPFGEICWYFTESWEQFRINGRIDIVDGSNSDHLKLQQREKAWFSSSMRSRLQYLGPAPGFPVINDAPIEESHLEPSNGPVDSFCLLIFDPEECESSNLETFDDFLKYCFRRDGNLSKTIPRHPPVRRFLDLPALLMLPQPASSAQPHFSFFNGPNSSGLASSPQSTSANR